MPTLPSGPGTGRFLISARKDADRAALTAFIEEVGRDKRMKLVDLIGPKESPHTLVVEMSNDMANLLATRFHTSNQLLIEPDRPVSMFK
ncbi:MAG: hypothetical protein V4582_00020 [Pseudomonadota bacterium]